MPKAGRSPACTPGMVAPVCTPEGVKGTSPRATACCHPCALQGRSQAAPLQGANEIARFFPGRCPGLVRSTPSACEGRLPACEGRLRRAKGCGGGGAEVIQRVDERRKAETLRQKHHGEQD